MKENSKQQDLKQERFLVEFTKIRSPLYGYIFSLIPHRDDAEDVFQRTSLILFQKIDQFDENHSEGESGFFSWACGVAFYEVKNFLRVASRKRVQFRQDLMQQIADERIESLKQSDQRLPALQSCLQKLQQKDRELLHQAYQSCNSIQEIALDSGKAVQSLYNRLNILRRQLARCISQQIAISEEQS
ncbi:hypothetical protein MNBD_PLANCTO02-1627 [hydrothermal vent metagenome]|uniref:Uncharacterized protein n=1 Tax=hydrothermal vent metagenome TaxID=652676 RepID=A0A3B1D213_9ZZZZ